MSDLPGAMVDFSAMLRREHAFIAGPQEVAVALRALETVGIRDRSRVRAALRCVFCGKAEQIEPFDRAFALFFSREGLGQPQPRIRETGEGPLTREPSPPRDGAAAWDALRARYSPTPGSVAAPSIAREAFGALDAEARRLIARLRLGPSRRWVPRRPGARFDVRRTLRNLLRTSGEPIDVRWVDRPRRNPRVVAVIDGSRSMTKDAERSLQFAAALCRTSRRTRAFVFSTALHDVTRPLREAPTGRTLDGLGEAWGGGTRIGANLMALAREYGALFSRDTYVMIFSDGLDTGDTPLLRRAMRQIAEWTSGIAWVNPHAGGRDFAPRTSGMRAAMPYVSALVAPCDVRLLPHGRRT
jgi:uncharacterized protein with von Willebrand factor type A (vWA) domain